MTPADGSPASAPAEGARAVPARDGAHDTPVLAPPPLKGSSDPPPRWSGPLGWILNDLPLKVLALLLAIMMWTLVRGKIDTSLEEKDVAVELVDVPDTIRIERVKEKKVNLMLFGTTADVERVHSDLVRTGRRITLRLSEFIGDSGTTQPIADPRKFAYPFEGGSEVVQRIMSPVQFTWHRVQEVVVDVTFAPSDLLTGRPEIQLLPRSVKLDPPKVRVKGPVSVIRQLAESGVLPLDPIDATRWLAEDPDFTVPMPFESSFSEWRGNEALKDPDLLTIDPPAVHGTLRMKQIQSEAIENSLRVLLPPGVDRAAFADWDWEIAGTGGEYDRTRRTIKLGIKGDQTLVEELKAKPGDWCFVIQLPPPPADGDPPPTDVKTPVLFQWLTPSAPSMVRLESGPTVFVSLKKKR